MATLTLTNSYGDDWPPDALEGGTITARSGTAMTYTSAMGYTITLRGTGLVYDDDGMPAAGIVTRVIVRGPAGAYSDFTGVSTDFAQAGMKIFGYDRDNGGFQDPDGFGFFRNLMRGNDVVNGSADYDDLRGGAGNDTVNCGAGDDYFDSEAGDDSIDGGDGRDVLAFQEANYSNDAFRGVNLDAVTGIAIDNWGFTDRFANFERYRDSIFSDTLKGSGADEDFRLSRGADLVDGRGGFDSVDYRNVDRWGAHHGIKVNLVTGIVIDSWKSTDTLRNIESVRGTKFADRILGSANDENFLGGDGADTIDGGGGSDWLEFWNVGDNGPGHGITVDLGAATTVLDDGFGNAEKVVGIENIYGSRYDDSITGDGGSNRLQGGDDGKDTVNGGGGEDFVSGGSGNDLITGGAGTDHLNGDRGNDTLTGNAGDDDFNFQEALADGGVDLITDMTVGSDEIWLASWWGGLAAEFLVANQFRSGAGATTATTANHRVIYNSTTGDLYFDADGAGGAAAVRFAVLGNTAAIGFDDFHVFL